MLRSQKRESLVKLEGQMKISDNFDEEFVDQIQTPIQN